MGKRRRVLFVCEGNIHRSPTAERMYADAPGLRARSGGLSHLARTQVTEELLECADVVVVRDKRLERMLRRRFGAELDGKEVVCLEVPDEYQFMQAELIAVLGERLTPHLGPPPPGWNERDS